MAMSRQDAPALYVEGLSGVTLNKYKAVSPIYEQIFNVGSSKKLFESYMEMAGIGRLDTFRSGQPVIPDVLTQGWITTFIHQKYGKSLSFERDAIQDELYGKLGINWAGMAGEAARNTEEQAAVSIFVNGFSDTGPDGVSLFNASHPLIRPRNGFSTYSNYANAAFSGTALKSGLIAYKRQVTEEGEYIDDDAVTLLHPTDLMFDVEEVLGSALSTTLTTGNTAANNVNSLRNIVKPLRWARLPSANDWFLLGPKEKMGLTFLFRERLRTRKWIDDATENINYACSERFSVGYKHARYIWGSAGGS